MSTNTGKTGGKSTGAPKNNQEKIPSIQVKIQRLFEDKSKSIWAVVDVTIGGAFAVHGLKVMENGNGTFVAMPSSSYQSKGETKYQEQFHPVTTESRKQLNQAVLKAYEKKLSEQQGESQKSSDSGLPEDESEESQSQTM